MGIHETICKIVCASAYVCVLEKGFTASISSQGVLDRKNPEFACITTALSLSLSLCLSRQCLLGGTKGIQDASHVVKLLLHRGCFERDYRGEKTELGGSFL